MKKLAILAAALLPLAFSLPAEASFLGYTAPKCKGFPCSVLPASVAHYKQPLNVTTAMCLKRKDGTYAAACTVGIPITYHFSADGRIYPEPEPKK